MFLLKSLQLKTYQKVFVYIIIGFSCLNILKEFLQMIQQVWLLSEYKITEKKVIMYNFIIEIEVFY